MEGYWVWCGSVICGEDGRYHMFASRWRQDLAFSPHWLTNSEVVRAEADVPEGPYQFKEVVLPVRDERDWDGRMTHNPTIHRAPDGTYLLFYTGTTYHGPTPTPEAPLRHGDPVAIHEPDVRMIEAHRNQRIGLATAPAPTGPWTRRDQPILQPRAGKWDSLITTNPAPCVTPEGRILLIYKSVAQLGGMMHLGATMADDATAPFVRLSDQPLFHFGDAGTDVEDPCPWYEEGCFHMIMKDMRGGVSGEPRGGIQLTSRDGLRWDRAYAKRAYSRTVTWDDDSVTTQAFLERPQLLIDNGRPTHLFLATAIGAENIGKVTRSWNMVIPLRPVNGDGQG